MTKRKTFLECEKECVTAFASLWPKTTMRESRASIERESIQPPELPLPRNVPLVKLNPTPFYININGEVLQIPRHLLSRHALLKPLQQKQSLCTDCDCTAAGWPNTIYPNDVFVLSLKDFAGAPVHGWFVRFRAEPLRLVHIPLEIAGKLFLRLHEGTLKRSSLYTSLIDIALIDERFPFDELLRRTLRCLSKIKPHQSNKRKFDCQQSPLQQSVPASPTREMKDCCSLCQNEAEIVEMTCCGISGGTCRKCNARVRGLCTLCDRQTLTSSHNCDTCRRDFSFDASGYPCAVCGRASVCSTCHSDCSVCWACIEKS